MSPRRTTEADSHGTRRAARAAKLASIGQTASPRGMKFARRPDEKRTATHTDRPAPAHKPGVRKLRIYIRKLRMYIRNLRI